MPNYRVGPQPGGPLYEPDSLNNREGPQAREPSKWLNRRSYGERLAKETFWSPATRGLKKDSDRAITPVTEAVRVPAPVAPAGSPQAKKLCCLHAQLSLGQSCHRQKKVVSMHTRSLLSCPTLWPCRLWLARLLYQRGGSSGKNIGVYWPKLVTIPL